MAVSPSTQWEAEATGSDSNSGGFDASFLGTDYTYGAGQKTITFNGSTITASNVGAGATITLGGYTVLAGDVGNTVNITGGTNFTASTYQIISVSTGANTWTLDRNCTTGAGAAMTGVAGGAKASPGGVAGTLALSNVGVSGQIVNIKAGTYAIGTGTANTPGNRVNTSVSAVLWQGYQATRGDGGTKPVLQAGGNSITLFSTANTAIVVENLEFQAGAATSILGLTLGNTGCIARNCKINGTNAGGATTTGANCMYIGCEATGCSGGNAAFYATGGNTRFIDCYSHGNSNIGFRNTGGGASDNFSRCIAAGNSATGFSTAGSQVVFSACLSYGNTGSATSGFETSTASNVFFNNCMAINNGTGGTCYGFSSSATSPQSVGPILYNCAAYGNLTGDTSGTLRVNIGFQSLSGDPTVAGGSGNFALNATAGAGAACKAAGWPSSWPGLASTTGYPDIGPVQSQAGNSVAFSPVGACPAFIQGVPGR